MDRVEKLEPPAASGGPGRSRSPFVVAVIAAAAFFMEMLDSTVIVTALPQMAESFGRSAVDLSLGLTVYMLALTIFIPASGWIADRFGARRVFCAAIAVFTLASIWCGMSNGLWEFVAARIVQGIGGALMSPVGRLVVLKSTGKSDLVRVINFLTVPGLIAPVIGPPLGGFITTYISWRWIFFINVPIGIIGIVLAWWLVRDPKAEERRPFDLVGFALNGLAMAALIYGLDLAAAQGSIDPKGIALAAAGLVVGYFALRHARRHAHPLVDLAAMRVATFRISNTGGSLYRISMAAPIFVMPLFFQIGLGMTAFVAGMLILAHTGGDLAMKLITTRTLRRFGFRSILIWSALLYAVFIAACIPFQPDTPLLLIGIVLFASGCFRSLQMTALTSIQFADIPQEAMTDASTLSGVIQQVLRALGIAIAALLLNLSVMLRGAEGAAVAMVDFRLAFLAAALVSAASLWWYVRMRPDTAAHVSGHRP